MYKIYADETLIYDSTIEDYKIGKGSVSLEVNKSGSFTFSVYPDHPFFDKFVKLKTVITVYKSSRIIFRGRILNDVTDHWNNKVITCEGELGFLQDSIIRPFDFSGTPEELFTKFIEEHNSQVDEFKKFKVGKVTVLDPNDYITRSNSAYETTFSNLSNRLLGDSLGGYIYITHGEDGTETIPTIHYLVDFEIISTQEIQFGSNLKNYTKTVNAEEIATAVIPLGYKIDDGNAETEDKRLTIAEVNDGLDYVYDPSAVALYGWIFKVVTWDDVTVASNLKAKGEEYLEGIIKQTVSVELNAIDLHLLDKSIESFNVCEYVRCISSPHNFAETLLCQKQTIDLLKPDNDTIVLGHAYSTFTDSSAKTASAVSGISGIHSDITGLNRKTTSYKIAEQQLTSLLAQSFGVFRTTETLSDGSAIQYLHDRPELADSTTIWKMTRDAFAVSTDGGKTWNAGMDSDGNALVNVLSAIGIEATWINADNLSAISANLGGWIIDGNAIRKDAIDSSNPSNVYRVYFQPPDPDYATGTWVLSCQKSTDGGNTFYGQFVLYSDGSAKFGSTRIYADGSAKFGTTFITADGAINFGDTLSLLEDGTLLWQDPDTGSYSGQITRQSDGSLHVSFKSVSVENLMFDTIGGNEPYSGPVSFVDGNGNTVEWWFMNGLLRTDNF